MKYSELISAAKEVAYVPSLDRICVITAWLGNHVIVDLGFADQRLTATPEPTPESRPYRSSIGAQISNCADQVADR